MRDITCYHFFCIMQLKNNVFVVTGGASGLGEATVRMVVNNGGKVAILDMNEERGAALVKELGSSAHFWKIDICSEESVNRVFEEIIKTFGGVHGVLNCAGIATAVTTLRRDGPADLATFKKVIDINVIGTFNVSRVAAWYMSKQAPCPVSGDRGVIITVSSVAAYEGQKGQAGYGASKGAVSSITLPMARDLARFNIRVAAIAPGIFGTPMVAAFPDKVRQSLEKDIPLGRFGKPEEFADAACFIFRNSYINGTTIRVDGGVRMSNL